MPFGDLKADERIRPRLLVRGACRMRRGEILPLQVAEGLSWWAICA